MTTLMRKSTVAVIVVLAVLIVGAGVAFMQQRARRIQPGAPVRKGDLQRELENARPGQTITLDPGVIYKGPFTLPAKSGNEYITIQTAKIAELKEGVRVTPAQTPLLAKLQ